MTKAVTEITLSHPLDDGRTSLRLRRPRTGDLRRMQEYGNQAEQTFYLVGQLAELGPEEVDQIDVEDFEAIALAIEGMLGKRGKPSGRAASKR
ncbi:phage tail assembly protein [Fodinicurvata sp. EGI_FJ10296]|uniref:phage tail assembly protein n=1 Tax=Fodinicurvata sp. EGI_FJ10296 TaxID=3231908 RepID=UPI003457156B